MPTFYFHAGMNKTGSSAIQDYLYRHRRELAEARLAYPSLPAPNHSAFLQSTFGPGKDARARQLMLPHGTTEEHLAELLEGFRRFLAQTAAAGNDAIVSGEATQPLGRPGYRELRDFAREAFDRAVALAFVRPPLSFARSAVQQRLKGALRLRTMATRLPVPDYRRRFEPLIGAFGADNVRFRLFHRTGLIENDVLQTLLAMTDGDRSALAGERAPKTNVSVTMPGAKALALLNDALEIGSAPDHAPAELAARLSTGALAAFIAERKGQRPQQLPTYIVMRILAIPGGPVRLPFKMASEILAASREDTAWMSERMGEDLARFDDPLPADDGTAFDAFSDDEIAAVAGGFDAINALDEDTVAELSARRGRRKAKRRAIALKDARGRDSWRKRLFGGKDD